MDVHYGPSSEWHPKKAPIFIRSKERRRGWCPGKGGGGWSEWGQFEFGWTAEEMRFWSILTQLILCICFFLFISRRQKRTKDAKALKRPYKSRVHLHFSSTHARKSCVERKSRGVCFRWYMSLFIFLLDFSWYHMEDKAQDTQRISFFIVKTTVKVD